MNSHRARMKRQLAVEMLEDRRLLSQASQPTFSMSAPGNRDSQAEFGPQAGSECGVANQGPSLGGGGARDSFGPRDSGGSNGLSQQGCGNPNNSAGPANNASVQRGNDSGRSTDGTNAPPSAVPPPANSAPSQAPSGAHGGPNDPSSFSGYSSPPQVGRGGPNAAPLAFWTSVILGSSASSAGAASLHTGGDLLQQPSTEAAAVVTADASAQNSAQDAAVAALVTLAIMPQPVNIVPGPVPTSTDALGSHGLVVGIVRETPEPADEPLPNGAQASTPEASTTVEAGEAEAASTPLAAVMNLLGNGLDMTDPQAADLITGFLPFSAQSLEHAIDQFLEPLEGLEAGMPELVEPSNLGPATWAVAVTVVALDVAIRIRRSRREGKKIPNDEPTPRFPGLPGHWRWSRS